MNTDEALMGLAEKTAGAVSGTLSTLCSDAVEQGQVTVMPAGGLPLESLPFPVLASDVSYTEGVTGGNLFVISRLGARRLAAAMMSAAPPTQDDREELDEIEMSAIGEAMNQMMAASAGALAAALGYPVDISVPTTRVLRQAAEAEGVYPQTPHSTSVSFTLLGEPCRLVQLIPNAFVVRMARALEGEQSDLPVGEGTPAGAADGSGLSEMLRDIEVRVSAELGRATLALAQLAQPHPGAVVELDRSAEHPIDLCVNGHRIATGQLLLLDEEWALRIEHVLDVDPADYLSPTGGP